MMILAPQLFGLKGGVEVYTQVLLEALQQHHPTSPIHLFLKYESPQTPIPPSLTHQSTLTLTPLGEHPYDTHPWRRRYNSLRSLIRILWAVLTHRPHLIILTHLNHNLLLCQTLKRHLKIPYWVILHGLEAWNIRHPSYPPALAHADRLLPVSHYTRDRLLTAHPLPPERITLLPNTIDPQRFTPGPKPDYLLQRHHLHPTQPILLTVTRLHRQARYKGHETLLRLLPHLRQSIPHLHYLLVGTGDDLPRLQAQIQQQGLAPCVTLCGFIPDSELPDYYRLCDVFALPSRGEGFGIVYLEALASGKPVLAGNQDGARDPLDNGHLGCLVDPQDDSAIATALIQLLQGTYPNPHLYQPQYLRQQVINTYGFPTFCQRVGTLLTEAGFPPTA